MVIRLLVDQKLYQESEKDEGNDTTDLINREEQLDKNSTNTSSRHKSEEVSDEDSSDSEVDDDNVTLDCLVCKSSEAIYSPIGCGHLTLCKRCAMKQATGGRCKVCKELFFELRKKC
ncbi:hypothetical protein BY996DRAFT_6723919 [Phakopsora pachyrhizi]|nr:hypothetical protein BY996DRAFT_6723919 [Phakopsora pachyrhizi]